MLNTVKNVMHSIGEGTGDIARRVGCTTSDVARQVGRSTAGAARRVSDGSVDLARKIGPRRGLIGLALIGAATVGTIYLVRYLRARREELPIESELEESIGGIPITGSSRRRGKRGTGHPMP